MIELREQLAKYERLKKSYDDPTFEVVSSVFRALSGRKIIGSGSFQRYVELRGRPSRVLISLLVVRATPPSRPT